MFCDQKERGSMRRHSKGEISFFSFLFAPHNKHTRSSALLCSANQIERKNGILRVRIDISGSLSGFEYCGDEEYGTKSIIVIDACLEDESDSVVVDLLCD